MDSVSLKGVGHILFFELGVIDSRYLVVKLVADQHDETLSIY